MTPTEALARLLSTKHDLRPDPLAAAIVHDLPGYGYELRPIVRTAPDGATPEEIDKFEEAEWNRIHQAAEAADREAADESLGQAEAPSAAVAPLDVERLAADVFHETWRWCDEEVCPADSACRHGAEVFAAAYLAAERREE